MADDKVTASTYTPSAGGVVTIPPWDGKVMACFIDSPGLLATLTIQLPAGAQDGQVVRIFWGNTVTLLTMTTLAGTIKNLLTAVTGGSSAVFAWNAATNSWWRG